MTLTSRSFLAIFSLATLVALDVSTAFAGEKIVSVGTASVTGVYYPAGGAFCRLVNRGSKESNIRCVVESTGGSINNLEALRKGDLDMGIVQSDLLYYAYNGTGIFYDVPADKNLRAVFALHSEPFTVITRRDAKINTFDDLKGKKINIGAAGSGQRATMEELMAKKGWTLKSFASVVDVKASDLPQALCSKKIDALIYSGGHPNGAVQQITTMCDTKIVDVDSALVDSLIKDHPFYARATIPGGMYVGNPKDIKTFGVRAMLAAPADMDADVVYQMVKALFDNLDNFKTLHPVFATLNAKQMVGGVDVAPFHPGALQYFREKDLIK
ncbi:MAG: TAXI family TRAP transporter solute-binding subunit [Alphaproteobacteria bacterium]|nr:TAXI family TRAP transporter solute-binding subunit [Alphaproteobacteria bacterium]